VPHPLPVPATPSLSGDDLAALETAVAALEKTSFAHRLAGLAGKQLGFAVRVIPERLQRAASTAAATALKAALRAAIASLDGKPARDQAALHRRLAMASGAIGGAAGLASLAVELPISTTIMLRAIADIARREGEDLREPEAALACLQVFALSGGSRDADPLDGGYFALRGLLAKEVSDAARYIAQRGVADEAAPVLVRLIGQIAARYGVVVSQKAAAQAVPIIGAISGAAINLAFTKHFQTLSRGHFTVRRLERLYGPPLVRAEYARIAFASGHWRERAGAA